LTEADESSEILKHEIARLHRRASHNAAMSQLFDLLWSAGVLILFWVVGAIIFHYMEGWSMGDAFYFNYVFFLTIGFGDFSPGTPVGKTVFVIWALMAVPIMTNFVVTTIQAVVERLSKLLALTAREKRMERQRIIDEYYESHENYLLSARAASEEGQSRSTSEQEADGEVSSQWFLDRDGGKQGPQRAGSTSSRTSDQYMPPGQRSVDQEGSRAVRQRSEHGPHAHPPKDFMQPSLAAEGDAPQTDESAADEERELAEALRHVLGLANYLEAQARALLIENLPEVSSERLLLQADTNVQISRLASLDEGLPPWLSTLRKSIRQDARMERIKNYRMTYAKFLVAGSTIMKLEGDKAAFWERRVGQKLQQKDA
jgi:potassium channel subfamily K